MTIFKPTTSQVKTPAPMLRGWNARFAYALGKLHHSIDFEVDSEDEMLFALVTAEKEGFSDYTGGRHDVPAMYRDEPVLIRAWREGHYQAQVEVASLSCPECQNTRLAFCSRHG